MIEKNTLNHRKVAILATHGVEEAELTKPREALEAAGAKTYLIAPEHSSIRAWHMKDWGKTYSVDIPLEQARPDDYDLLLLPGGVMNPDQLRMNPLAVIFVRAFFQAGKPIAAICHAPWLLIESGIIKGKTTTSYPSLKTDIKNAGSTWIDQEVVIDNPLITSRKPGDIPSFNKAIIETLTNMK